MKELILNFLKKEDKNLKSTYFSNFIRKAPSNKQKKVFLDAAKYAVNSQNKTMGI